MSRNLINGSEAKVIIVPLETNIISAVQDQVINGKAGLGGDVVINGRVADYEIVKLIGHTHVRSSNITRTNPDTSLIETLGNNIPVFESVGGYRALRIEPGATNNLLHCRDLTQADYIKTNATPLLDQVGETGVANSASSLLATAGNATCLQTLVLADTDYAYSISIKRITGTGNIEVTDDNGGNWTDIKSSLSTTAWYRHSITRSQANPVCGIRIVTNTDKIAVDYNQLESGKIGTSRILTTTGAVSRATESGYPLWDLPLGLFDAKGTVSVWARFGYVVADAPGADYGIVSTWNGAASLLYHWGSNNLYTHDGISSASKVIVWAANTWYKLILKWNATTLKMRLGVDSGAGIVWGSEVAFDGSYTLGASLRLGYELFGPMWLRDLRLYDRILSDSEINSTGSP